MLDLLKYMCLLEYISNTRLSEVCLFQAQHSKFNGNFAVLLLGVGNIATGH